MKKPYCIQVNEREAEVDLHIAPIEDMYALLSRYEVKFLTTVIQRTALRVRSWISQRLQHRIFSMRLLRW
jgi:hypothetical protein